MKTMTPQEYIEDRLDNQSRWYGNKAKQNKNNHYYSQIIVIALSALIPVFAGFDFGLEKVWKEAIIALMGVVIAVVSGLAGLYKFQEKWTEYRSTRESLKREKINYQTGTAHYSKANDPFPLLVERVESILATENQNWTTYIKTQDSG